MRLINRVVFAAAFGLAAFALNGTVANAQTVYVDDYNANTVYSVNTATGVRTPFVTSVVGPSGIAFDPSGNLFIASYDNNAAVFKADSLGNATLFADFSVAPTGEPTYKSAGYAYIEGLAVDGSGNVYISAYIGDVTGSFAKVYKYDSTGTFLGVFGGLSVEDSYFYDMEFDASGNLLVVDNETYDLYRTTPGGVTTKIIANATTTPIRGVTTDSDGDIYISEGTRIRQYDASGNLLNADFITGLSSAEDVDYGSDGLFYVVDYQGSSALKTFNGDGTPNNNALSLGRYYYTAFNPASANVAAPEPGTLALLLLPTLGIVARKKRNAA